MDLGKLLPAAVAALALGAAVGCGSALHKTATQPPIVAKGAAKGALTIAQWPL
jgi:predicted outer membrane protein